MVGCRRRAAQRPRDTAVGVSEVFSLEELPRFLARCDYLVSTRATTAIS